MSRSDLDVRDFAAAVLGYCLAYSGSVTSWCRSVDHNTAVGGVPASAHLLGLAVDVIYDGAAPGPDADDWLRLHALKRLREGTHDHLMPLDWRA